jgi:hypothetical protein
LKTAATDANDCQKNPIHRRTGRPDGDKHSVTRDGNDDGIAWCDIGAVERRTNRIFRDRFSF